MEKLGKEISKFLSQQLEELKQRIESLTSIPSQSQKLMSVGRILKDEATLRDQGLKNNCKLLILRTAAEEVHKEQLRKEERDGTRVERLTKAAVELSERNHDDDGISGQPSGPVVELVNQNGERIRLSPEDEKALKLAMTLHDKGRALMRRGEYAAAAELYTESEKAFTKCSPSFLSAIDNFGLLCLDLCWCYFKMQNLDFLRDADKKLKTALECLERSHGKNFERLLTVKGTTGADLVLWCRLFLLQAIVAFHSSRHTSARQYITRAEEILKSLKLNDTDLVYLISMGFTEREARIALRTHGNVTAATQFILSRRKEKQRRAEEERRKRRQERERRKYGKTANGLWVDLDLLHAIVRMGFQKELVIEALRQADNNQESAVNLLTQSPDLLVQAATMATESRSSNNKKNVDMSENKIQQLEAMGFPRSLALGTLRKTGGNLDRAVELLLNGQGEEATDSMDISEQTSVVNNTTGGQNPTVTSTTASITSTSVPEPTAEEREATAKREEQERLKREAEEELIQDVDQDEDAHLDVTLNEEEATLLEYKQKLLDIGA